MDKTTAYLLIRLIKSLTKTRYASGPYENSEKYITEEGINSLIKTIEDLSKIKADEE